MLKYFGTDGVRGVANQDLSPELAFKLGRDGGYVLTKNKAKEEQAKVLVSRDTRISGQMLEYALISGLLSVGIEVLEVGVITTPGLSYLVRAQGADAGVQISASHNPVEDNGIKFFGSDGLKLSDEMEGEIEQLIDAPEDKCLDLLLKGWGLSLIFTKAAQSIYNLSKIQFLKILAASKSLLMVLTALLAA